MRLFVAASLLLATPAFAASDDVEKALESNADKGARDSGGNEALPEIGEDKLQEFVLERGFYFSGDLGVFLSFTGVKAFSNVQPYMALRAGFDINDFIGVEAALNAGYVSQNPVSQYDVPGGGGLETQNYGLLGISGLAVFAVRPSARIAVEPKVGGGISFVSPEITDPGNPDASFPSTGHVVGGLDLKYLTLLTDFTAGISLNGYYLLAPGVLAGSAAFVVRYTF